MGFWNDGLRSRSRSRSRSPSRHRKTTVRPGEHHEQSSRGPYSRPSANRSASSFLESVTGYSQASRSAPGSQAPSRNQPSRSNSYSQSRGFFGFGSSKPSNNHSYGSSSRARPRSGLVAKIKRWLSELLRWLKKHPMKVFFLVIMPLITGGALTKLLSKAGIRLPPQLERMIGSNMRGMGGQERLYARGGARDFAGGTNLPGMMGGAGGMGGGLGESAMGMMKIARMFM